MHPSASSEIIFCACKYLVSTDDVMMRELKLNSNSLTRCQFGFYSIYNFITSISSNLANSTLFSGSQAVFPVAENVPFSQARVFSDDRGCFTVVEGVFPVTEGV